MYVHANTHTHTHTHTQHTHTHTHTHACTHIHMCVCTHPHACTHTRTPHTQTILLTLIVCSLIAGRVSENPMDTCGKICSLTVDG